MALSSTAASTADRPHRARPGRLALAGARPDRWVLAVVIVIASGVRWWGLDYSLPSVFYPDEGRVMEDVRAMAATGTLRPEYFSYPTFWLYVLAVLVKAGASLSLLVGAPFGPAPLDNPTFVYGTGRAAAALAGTLTLIPLYLVTERVARAFGVARPALVGLLACGFLGLAPLHVQHSKIASPDVPTTAFVTLALFACLRIFEDGRTRWYVLAALATGAAAGTKYPSALAAITLVVAHVARHCRAGGGSIGVVRRIGLDYRIWLAGLLTACFFLATSPYVLLDYERFRADLAYEASKAFDRGANGLIGSAGRAEGALFVPTVLRRGLDTLVALFALLGLGWAAWVAVRRPSARGYVALLLTYPLLVYLFTWSWR
ncbi:MAG: glycosyltransferase family 39 protein, partial [Chloroflexota bacterium]|nr:glycosyltransferase family 39 protein [Chloroflexota bacterium]